MKKQEISYENLSVLLSTAYSLQLNTQKFHWSLIVEQIFRICYTKI
ncbi:MAG: hypothetical protein IRD7MM_05655 [Candidatus Midichloria mitochondrii]